MRLPWYRVEIVRMEPNGPREVIGSYQLPEAIIAEAVLANLTVDGIYGELKRRLKEEG